MEGSVVMSKLIVVVGGQFGSEAKGHVTKRLLMREVQEYDARCLVVRVGGPNAGHTVLDADEVAWPLRQVPVGAVVPEAQLLIAAGSEVDPDVLLSEIDRLREGGHDLVRRLHVSSEATVLTVDHQWVEKGEEIQHRIGSTAKGIGAARVDRIKRTARRVIDDAKLCERLRDRGVFVHYDPAEIPRDYDTVIIEGTQGYGLGLHAGYYPYCTSSDCRAIDFMSMAGVSPWQFSDGEVWIAVRPFPIRVAGNSGPLHKETSWDDLGLPPEFTTVTKKTRRVGRWDSNLVRAAVAANGGTQYGTIVNMAFTMADQVVPELAGRNADRLASSDSLDVWINAVEQCGATVKLVTTGPDTGFFL
jgi:adenylosuccinate synthase